MKKTQKRRFEKIELIPKMIGRIKRSGKKVWLQTDVVIKFKNGATKIYEFDTKKEAFEFVGRFIKKEREDAAK